MTLIVKTVGAGKDFATPQLAAAYINGRNLAALDETYVMELWDNVTGDCNLNPAGQDGSHGVVIRPAPSVAAATLNNTGAAAYGTVGVEWTMVGTPNFGPSVTITGLRLNLNSVYVPILGTINKCRIKINNTARIQLANYSRAYFLDNFVDWETGGDFCINDQWDSFIHRNTFIRRAGAGGPIMHGGWTSTCEMKDNVFFNCGDTPFYRQTAYTAGTISNNYTNVTPVSAYGFVVNTATAFFENGTSDFRPSATSPLLGNGSALSESRPDMRENNRGPDPDVGAVQRTPAVALPVMTVTSQPPPSGQKVTIAGTTTGTPSSGTVTFVPNTVPDGAITQGPYVLTLGAGTFTTGERVLPPGNYLVIIVGTNAGGVSEPAAANGITILGITGSGELAGSTPTPPGDPVALQLSTDVRNLRAAAFETVLGASPRLQLRTGAPPANPAAAATGTILVDATLPADFLTAPSNGVVSKNGTWAGIGLAAAGATPGTAVGHFRLITADGSSCKAQGTVTATGGGGDMTMTDVTVEFGQLATVATFSTTEGNA